MAGLFTATDCYHTMYRAYPAAHLTQRWTKPGMCSFVGAPVSLVVCAAEWKRETIHQANQHARCGMIALDFAQRSPVFRAMRNRALIAH